MMDALYSKFQLVYLGTEELIRFAYLRKIQEINMQILFE